MLQDGSIFAQSPSFNSYSSDNFAEIAAKVCEEFVDDRVQLGLEPLSKEGNDDKPGEIVQVQEEKDDLTQEEEEEEDDDDKPGEIVQVQEDKDDLIQEEEEDDDDFEFSFLSGDGMAISADEIFANGQIRPVFPIFNRDLLFAGGKDYDEDDESKQPKKNSSLRKLFIGEREEEEDVHSFSSSEADELDNLPAGTYCVWKPKQTSTTISSNSPDTCKKSKSTGSSSSSSQSATTASVSKRWRFRDFLFRSNSDGKDTFVFLTPASSSTTNKMMMKNRKEEKLEKVVVSGEGKVVGKGKSKTGAAEVSAHEIHYVRNRALKENDRKKSYLPYRQDLVGFFANVNGLSRNLHPF